MEMFKNWDREKKIRLKKQLIWAMASFIIYCILGWKVAVLILGGVAFHECGHIWAAHKMGMKTKGFYLIPFMGGAAIIEGPYLTYWQQAFTVLMGPLWGGALAFGCALMYWLTGSVEWVGAGSWLAWMNMFNLLPLGFLDGGQILETITYSISQRLGLICKSVSIAVAVPILWGFNPIISVLVGVGGGAILLNEYKNFKLLNTGRHREMDTEYRNRPKALSKKELAITVVTYVVMLSALFWLSTKMSSINNVDVVRLLGTKRS